MNKKLIFLFIALLLPGLIYTFLKMFGSNTFAVAPLFQDQVTALAGCPAVSAPYVLPGNVFNMLSSTSEHDSLLLIFYKIDEATLGATAGNINEIEKNISAGNEGMQLIKINNERFFKISNHCFNRICLPDARSFLQWLSACLLGYFYLSRFRF